MAEPAPYGGLLTKTLDDEKEQENKLKQQAITINVNGTPETIRPEAVHIRGLDNLSTDDIKAYVDYYINYNVTESMDDEAPVYEQLPYDEQSQFRVQWINDESVNLAFKTHAQAAAALAKLSVFAGPHLDQEPPSELTEEYVAQLVQEREGKPYSAIENFKKQISLASRLGDKNGEESTNDDEGPRTIELFLRLSFQSDRKIKNASAYSRYYLFHGEPDRSAPQYRNRERRGRGNKNRSRGGRKREEEPDLFAERLDHRSRAEEDDLFADRLRERSPIGSNSIYVKYAVG